MNWAPTTDEGIVQNVQSLIATAQGTQPMARALGMPTAALDAPVAVAQARIASALNGQIRLYETRATVGSISVEVDADGAVGAKVVLK